MELFGLRAEEIGAYLEMHGTPKFRGKQIADWMYIKGKRNFSDMTNLPAALISTLTEKATITRAEIIREAQDTDGTTKYLLRFRDQEAIETVLIPNADRTSVCVSTQVGCKAGCRFCATAMRAFKRNLTPGEILDQVLTLQELSGTRVSNVVFMGMGEPLENYDNVIKAMKLLNEEIGISMRHITVSTVGITPAIKRLAELDLQITLAISLHATTQEKRRKLIPMSVRFPLKDLMSACKDYLRKTGRRITFEYLLIAGINDSQSDAIRLTRMLKGMICHVNLVPYNEVSGKSYVRPEKKQIAIFKRVLDDHGIQVTMRKERGSSVAAACGQLKGVVSEATQK